MLGDDYLRPYHHTLSLHVFSVDIQLCVWPWEQRSVDELFLQIVMEIDEIRFTLEGVFSVKTYLRNG